MKPSLRYRKTLDLTCLLVSALFCAFSVLAAPRQPFPPLPEMTPVLYHENFDTPYFTSSTNRTETVTVDYGLLVSSWSGYALERAGTVTPFVVPALDGMGRTNVACASGGIRFWVTPYWASASVTNGNGPGVNARLLELVAVGEKEAAVAWSLQVNADGNALSLIGQSETGAVQLLSAEIAWAAQSAHCLVLNYSPTGTVLYVDGQLAATGAGTYALPPSVAGLVAGSTVDGTDTAGGYVDKLYAFGKPVTALAVYFHYHGNADEAAFGPVTAEEWAARQELLAAWAKQKAEKESEGGGGQMMMLVGGTSYCLTNVPVFITNTVSALVTNQGWTVMFDIQGGTNGLLYDVFTTTNLTGSHITNSAWTWLEQGPTCSTYQYTNQPDALAFFILGTPQDSDGDGLTDAYENLVSKTDPNLSDTDGDGISDRDELVFGLNPRNLDDSAQSGLRMNYTYDTGGWLLNVSGIIGEGFGYDAEGNVTP